MEGGAFAIFFRVSLLALLVFRNIFFFRIIFSRRLLLLCTKPLSVNFRRHDANQINAAREGEIEASKAGRVR